MAEKQPLYDFNLPLFRKNPLYIRLAQEHVDLVDFSNDSIQWEVLKTRSSLKIPTEYRVTYNFPSIIGINSDQSPIFGNRHVARITLPTNYPVDHPILYMESNVWHPNIKWQDRFKGRICGNTKGFATQIRLVLLIIRIADILKYNNYHAEHTPPYPEDSDVADWVKNYAEPYGVVSKAGGLNLDFTPPIIDPEFEEEEEYEEEDFLDGDYDEDMPPKKKRRKISIRGKRATPPPKPNRFKIKPRKRN